MAAPAGKWYTLEPGDVLENLRSSKKGLSKKEAIKRLRVQGPNELAETEKPGPVKIFLRQFRSFLVIILVVAALLSLAINQVVDTAVILIIVILNAAFGFVQEFRAERAIEALKKMTSPETLVLREGKRMKVQSRELVQGDIVLLEEGTKIPADIRLLETANLKIDEASLTGESEPVTKQTGRIKEAILAEQKNMVFRGTHVAYGHGIGVVTATGMRTELGGIARTIEQAGEESTPLQKRLGRFGKNLGFLILAISAIVILGGVLRSYPPADMVLIGISLAVAAIPEGLPAVVTITLALSLQKLSKENALVKKLPAVETLGSTTVICSDKTGTLTKNEMTVRKLYLWGKMLDVTGKGYEAKGKFLHQGKPFNSHGLQTLLRTGSLCNNASLQEGKVFGDPTEAAILVAAAKGNVLGTHKRIGEIPFSSERKMMSTINLVSGKRVMSTKGAIEVVLEKCTKILKGGRVLKLTQKERKELLEVNHAMSGKALRVLGFAYKDVRKSSSESDLVFVGMMGMIDPPRDSVKQDVFVCRRAGIKPVMITGDHKDTAVAIASEIGLMKENDLVLTGEELGKLSEKEFSSVVEKVSVYARVNPSDKVRIIAAFKKKGHVVAMTGDGVNDAPALKKADIGVAMGIKGTDVSKEAADMVLSDDNFSSIVSAVRLGRGVYDNINKFIRYLLSSNVAEVGIIFLALLLFFSPENILLPLLAVQILWVNLITDGLPALALGVDPVAAGVMARTPRPQSERLLSRKALSFILWVGAIITIGTLWVFSTELENGLQKAQTMAFTTLVMFEMFNVFNVHSFATRERLGVFSNKKLLLAVGASILLQLLVVYFPPLQAAFSTVSLAAADWVKILLVSVTVIIIMGLKQKIKG